MEGKPCRQSLAIASVMGIYALMNSGDGPINGFAYYFGVKNKLPHGLAGGMFLDDVMRYNSDRGFSYRALLGESYPRSDYDFYEDFERLKAKISLPKLRDLGYLEADKDFLIPQIIAALTGSFDGNPVQFDERAVERVLDKHLQAESV